VLSISAKGFYRRAAIISRCTLHGKLLTPPPAPVSRCPAPAAASAVAL